MGMPVAELVRRARISEQTFYRWKKQYPGLEVDQVRQLKQLQEENGRLKKLVAKLTLDRAMCRMCCEKTGSALTAPHGGPLPVRRVPGERAARLSSGGFADLDLPVPEPKNSADRTAHADAPVGECPHSLWISQAASSANRKGWKVDKKLVYHLYREEGLSLRTRPRKRRTVSEHSRQKPLAEGPNHVWRVDLVADQFADGRRFRALTVVDVYTRECLAIEVGQSLKGHDGCGSWGRSAGNGVHQGFCSVRTEVSSLVR